VTDRKQAAVEGQTFRRYTNPASSPMVVVVVMNDDSLIFRGDSLQVDRPATNSSDCSMPNLQRRVTRRWP
jgi:hypothetical protein